MTSIISTSGINANYPVAGVSNDSQGFRDNFLAIKTQLDNAASEITTLQDYTAKTNANNDFAGNVLEDYVALKDTVQGYQFSSSLGTGTVTLNWNNGSYQYGTTSAANGTRTIAFSNFGTAGVAARMTVELDMVASGTNFIAFSGPVVRPTDPTNLSDTGTFLGASNAVGVGTHILEFLTRDAGTTVYLVNYQFYP